MQEASLFTYKTRTKLDITKMSFTFDEIPL